MTHLVVAVALVASIGSAHADPYRCKQASSAQQAIKQQQVVPAETACVDGEVIAVIAAYTGKVAALESSYAEVLERQDDAIYFVMMPGSYAQLVYVPVAGGDKKDVKDGDGKPYETEVEIIEARKKKTVGLLRDAHLVRMEINGGRGAQAGEQRVVGKVIEILDDTKAYPLNISKLLHSTLAEFEKATSKRGARWRKEARKVVDAAVKADAKNLRGWKRGETLHAAYLARWSTDTNTLHITFYGRLSKDFWRRFKMPPRQPHHMGPSPPYVQAQLEYGSEYTVDLEFDINGKLIGEQEIPAVATDSDFQEFPEY
jgi:hypothetical protein